MSVTDFRPIPGVHNPRKKRSFCQNKAEVFSLIRRTIQIFEEMNGSRIGFYQIWPVPLS